KIGPDPRNFNQRVSLGRNDLLIRTFPSIVDTQILESQFLPHVRLGERVLMHQQGSRQFLIKY
ncbi:hypothetical protein ACU0NG_27730, partial [Klebsiella pneumoniae]